MTTLAVVVGLSLGIGLAFASYQARLALLSWLQHQRETHKPVPASAPPDSALVGRLEAVESELSRLKVERLTGRR